MRQEGNIHPWKIGVISPRWAGARIWFWNCNTPASPLVISNSPFDLLLTLHTVTSRHTIGGSRNFDLYLDRISRTSCVDGSSDLFCDNWQLGWLAQLAIYTERQFSVDDIYISHLLSFSSCAYYCFTGMSGNRLIITKIIITWPMHIFHNQGKPLAPH